MLELQSEAMGPVLAQLFGGLGRRSDNCGTYQVCSDGATTCLFLRELEYLQLRVSALPTCLRSYELVLAKIQTWRPMRVLAGSSVMPVIRKVSRSIVNKYVYGQVEIRLASSCG